MRKVQIKLIGTYKVLETIQNTPEWILLKALERDSNDYALIKIYLPQLRWSDELLNEFFDRIGYLKFIEHENLLAVKDFGKYKNTPYVVYPYHPFIFNTQNQNLQFDQVNFLDQFYKIAEAMDYLNRQEIVHGLLSPENILVDSTRSPKIFDHGLSDVLKKVLFENVDDNFTFLSLSNVKFTAPELLSGGTPTRQSDIYSYGLLFYLGIFSVLPFEGRAAPETAILHIGNNLSWIKTISRNLSKKALILIRKSITSKPENRFGSFQELLGVFAQIKNSNQKNRLFRGQPPTRAAKKTPVDNDLMMRTIDPLLSEDDIDKTFDDVGLVQEQPVQKKTSLKWVYAGMLTLTLVSIAAFYYLPALITANLNVKSTPSLGLGVETTKPVAISETLIVQATGTSIVLATSTPDNAPPLLTTEQPPQPIQASRPAIEGEQAALIPSENISSNNLSHLSEFSRLGFGKPEDVDISPDSVHFAVSTSAGVFIYKDFRFLKWLDPGVWASSVQFSPDGDTLAVGLANGEIQVWDWEKEYIKARLTNEGHSQKVTRVLFSKNGRHLFSSSNDRTVIMWDIEKQDQIRKISAHAVPVEDIAVSDDERTLITGAGDQYIRVWDLSNVIKPVWEIKFPGDVLAVAISSDGEYIAAGGDNGQIFQWSLVSRQRRTDGIPVKQKIWGIKYIDDDQTLFVALNDGGTKTYSASQQKYDGISMGFQIPPVDVALIKSFGSDFRGESYSDTYGNGIDNVSIFWNGKVRSRGKDLTQPFFDNLIRLIFSQDGKIVSTQGKRGITSVWNVQNNKILFKASAELPLGQPISSDNSTIAIIVPKIIHTSSSEGETVKINIYRWINLGVSGKNMDLSEVIQNGTVSYSPDGKLFISGTTGSSKVWDYESGFETFFVSNASVGCQITKSANDGTIFQIYSGAGTFFDLNEQTTNICKNSFRLKQYLLGMSNDLSLLAYTKANGWLEVYDPISDKILWTNNNHKDITAIAVSPDGLIIAIGNSSGILTFIDGKTGEDLLEIIGNYGKLQAIAFSNNGEVVGTAGSDGTVRLFGIFNQ